MATSQTMPSVLNKTVKTRTSEKIWLPVWRDTSGDLIATSAGYLSVKPYYDEYAVGVYHMTMFKAYSDAEFADELNTLDPGGWGGYGAYQAWMSEIHTGPEKTRGNDVGEDVTYVIRCIDRTDGWRFQHPDVGYIFKDGSDIKSFMSKDDCPYIGNLNGSGGDGAGTMQIILSDTKRTKSFSSISGL